MSKKFIWIVIFLIVAALIYALGFGGNRTVLLSSVVLENVEDDFEQVEVTNYSTQKSFYIHGLIMGIEGENDLKDYVIDTFVNGIPVSFNTYLYGGEMGEYLLHSPIRIRDDSSEVLTFVFSDELKEKFDGEILKIRHLVYNEEAGSTSGLKEYDVDIDLPIRLIEE